jgi:two-component system, chemotaxis family, CheB/CheR fusion protein
MTGRESPGFDALLDYLRRTRGFEFAAYKRGSIIRRVEKRMHDAGVGSFADYTDYLEVHPEEFPRLFDAILINVTEFFRDEETWDYMRDVVLPPLTAPAETPLRVWSAGCASGEEPYSMAMLLAEALGREQFQNRVKIYATDVDDAALNEARAGTYTGKQIDHVPARLRERYFAAEGECFVFDKELRRSVIFGRHDLVQDAPISRVNVLMCRNTLMYFNTEAQSRILARFHFGLADSGVLFLGKAEMLLTHTHLFAPLELKRRVFRKVAKDNWRERMAIMTQANGEEAVEAADDENILPAAFDTGPHAQFVIDSNGFLALFNDRARLLFGLATSDLAKPIQDLELSYRPIELRSLIAQTLDQRRPITLREALWEAVGHDAKRFDVHIAPLYERSGRAIGVSVSFVDVSRVQELQVQLDRSKHDLETAYEELQSTNEELETTNEELQSTVEELETTNEELQSTNEELETMNEELQSTNEELQTTIEELRQRSDELNHANGFLQSILSGVHSGVVVLDREMRVIGWNLRAEDLWGLRHDEVAGQNFLNLDIGLPTAQLRSAIRACLNGDGEFAEMTISATNRRGKPIECRVTSTPLFGPAKDTRGVILLMDEQQVMKAM